MLPRRNNQGEQDGYHLRVHTAVIHQAMQHRFSRSRTLVGYGVPGGRTEARKGSLRFGGEPPFDWDQHRLHGYLILAPFSRVLGTLIRRRQFGTAFPLPCPNRSSPEYLCL
jgi:hypothetical protein